MKALYFEQTGSLDHLRIVERPQPVPGPGEALVEIRAAAINPSDPKSVLGKIPSTKAPRIPGRDFAGVVVDGPAAWRGKEVFGTGGDLGSGRDGTHAQFAVIPVDALVEKPKDLTFEQAAALALGYLTAWSTMVTVGQVSAEDTVLIVGAAGAVGSSAAKIAKHRGAKLIIGTLRNEPERQRIASVPIDHWIVLEGKSLPEEVSQITGGRGADLILDAVGGQLFEPAGLCLAHLGRHVVIASNPPQVSFNLVDFYHRQGRILGVDTLQFSFAQSADPLRQVLPLVQQGVLTAPQSDPIPLEAAPKAYEAVLNGTAHQKQVIRFG